MVFELVGSRMLAPFLGTSLFVWTSIIGVVLGSLSLGYFFGGRLADKNPDWAVFSFIIFLGGLFIAVAGLLKGPVLELIQINIPDLRIGSLLASLILFAPASVVLGMVSPYAIRLKMESVAKSGTTAGNLYAISTIGSIVGTFLAGFFLISFFGTTRIIYILAGVLVATSLFTYSKGKEQTVKLSALLFFAGLSMFSPLLDFGLSEDLVDVDTNYNRVWIYDVKDKESGRKIRALITGAGAVQSAIYLDAPSELALEYSKYYRLADYFKPNIKKALLIGGGAYSYPKAFLGEHPNSTIDVVEIDPGLTKLSEQYFSLDTAHPRLNIYHKDGRIFLNNVNEKYDAVFMDAFGTSYAIPYQLATVEAVEKIESMLTPDGVVAVNLISALQGEKSKLFQAVYSTHEVVFPKLYVFQVDDETSQDAVQNIIMYALKKDYDYNFSSAQELYQPMLANLYRQKVETSVAVLTDEYAPVDRYVLEMLN